MELEEELHEFFTINTHKGLFRYKRLAFGLASVPSIFQRVMDTLLQGIPGVCVYFDDLLVTAGTEEEHLACLSEVLNCLIEAGMRLKKNKCAFLLPSLEHLGHVICACLKTSDSNVSAVTNAVELQPYPIMLRSRDLSAMVIPRTADIVKKSANWSL